MSIGHVVPSVKFLHFIRDLSLKTRYSAVIFPHFTCNVFEMYLQLKYMNFYDKDYMANIIQKLTHL